MENTTIDKELVEGIKHFEKVHKKYLNSDGSLNEDGYGVCHDYEINWGDDPKWADYFLFHLRPRLENYWYDEVQEDNIEDKNYRKHWSVLHPKLAKGLWD